VYLRLTSGSHEAALHECTMMIRHSQKHSITTPPLRIDWSCSPALLSQATCNYHRVSTNAQNGDCLLFEKTIIDPHSTVLLSCWTWIELPLIARVLSQSKDSTSVYLWAVPCDSLTDFVEAINACEVKSREKILWRIGWCNVLCQYRKPTELFCHRIW